ncbi:MULTISPECIES: diguanylate cyclase [unclassified Nocardia]|uniref:GGDEF domain-containing protein n=1 Tax=unclassified Nocardia TaxID=2637762 RepID=UPI001CE4201E|nr:MULTISPECIES: GGDEF domain-containing protein [unclassified Nocardia]
MADIGSLLRAWWRDGVDYRWLIETFESHSALAPMKIMIGSAGIVMASITALALLSQAGQRGAVGVTQAVVAIALALAWTLRWWLLPWPREGESLAWIAAIDVTVTANNVLVQDRLLGALGIVLLVTTGGYATIFHGPRILALHVGWSFVSLVLVGILMFVGRPGNTGHGKGDLLLCVGVMMSNICVTGVVLPIVHFSHWLVQRDAQSDPLTKLLNRRGLDSRLSRFFDPAARGGVYAVTFDLDRFKSVNDTFGHSLGDEVLVRTAKCLREAAPPGAVIARTGGEEFAVVGYLNDDCVGAIAERLRGAIETMTDLPITITASVGAAVTTLNGTGETRTAPLRQSLFRSADTAMYEAKRLGGNSVVIAEAPCREPCAETTCAVGQVGQ